jgi:hypothetical protein
MAANLDALIKGIPAAAPDVKASDLREVGRALGVTTFAFIVTSTQNSGHSITRREFIKLFHSDGSTSQRDYYAGKSGVAFKFLEAPAQSQCDLHFNSPTGRGRGEFWSDIDGLGTVKNGDFQFP